MELTAVSVLNTTPQSLEMLPHHRTGFLSHTCCGLPVSRLSSSVVCDCADAFCRESGVCMERVQVYSCCSDSMCPLPFLSFLPFLSWLPTSRASGQTAAQRKRVSPSP